MDLASLRILSISFKSKLVNVSSKKAQKYIENLFISGYSPNGLF